MIIPLTIRIMMLTYGNVYTICVTQNVKFPEVVTSQSVLETGWYQCQNCSLNKNNIFGFYSDRYLTFDHWIESVAYYKKWQDKYSPELCTNDEYLQWLKDFGYFTDENYIKKINDIL
jgi:flagellum-specific peptidoglycan hydrolase FlgJ